MKTKKFMDLGSAELLFSSKNQVPFGTIPTGSGKIFFWECDKGHEWEQRFRLLLESNGCQYCSGRKILIGFNDLGTLHPKIASEWDKPRNLPTTFGDVSFSSNRKVWWKCTKGHEWETTIAHRLEGKGCPVCAGRKIIPGVNDFLTFYPELEKEVRKQQDPHIQVTLLAPHSSKKIWWVCDKGHEWEATIDTRTKKTGGTNCPYCANKKFSEDQSTLLLSETELKYWDTDNNTFSPKMVSQGSKRKVNWSCNKCDYKWVKPVSTQMRSNICPVCEGKTVRPGFNDLATLHPILVTEWSPKNIKTPDSLTPGSEYKALWSCVKGHEWKAMVNNRTRLQQGCPSCWASLKTSTGEKEVKDFITSLGFAIKTSDRTILSPQELDIYIPEKNIAIEYNGLYWHSEATGKDKWYHYNKWLKCKEQGIQLIQIWEDDWSNRQQVIKSMLKVKLGVNDSVPVYARRLETVNVSHSDASIFLEENHIQGDTRGSIRVGLTFNGGLVAVLLCRLENSNEASILRYATSQKVVGGFTKLFSYVRKSFPNIQKYVTFSDNTVSDGGLYVTSGFHQSGVIPPDYSYLVKSQREHKFNYRLARFKSDPNMIFIEGKTEKELAQLNKMLRIWDAGKIRWEFK